MLKRATNLSFCDKNRRSSTKKMPSFLSKNTKEWIRRRLKGLKLRREKRRRRRRPGGYSEVRSRLSMRKTKNTGATSESNSNSTSTPASSSPSSKQPFFSSASSPWTLPIITSMCPASSLPLSFAVMIMTRMGRRRIL